MILSSVPHLFISQKKGKKTPFLLVCKSFLLLGGLLAHLSIYLSFGEVEPFYWSDIHLATELSCSTKRI